LLKKHVFERETYIPERETTSRDQLEYGEHKRKPSRTQEDRFSRPKLPSQWQKSSRNYNDQRYEKGPNSRKNQGEESQVDELLGKRHHQNYPEHPVSESENYRSLNLLTSENYSPLKMLKEATKTSYDKINIDMAFHTSRRTNQDLGSWPFRSEEEKQTQNSTFLGFLAKSKADKLQEHPEPRE
jgi:hypothetical protein